MSRFRKRWSLRIQGNIQTMPTHLPASLTNDQREGEKDKRIKVYYA